MKQLAVQTSTEPFHELDVLTPFLLFNDVSTLYRQVRKEVHMARNMATGVPNITGLCINVPPDSEHFVRSRALNLKHKEGTDFFEVVFCVVFVQCTLDVLTCIAMKENGHFRCM